MINTRWNRSMSIVANIYMIIISPLWILIFSLYFFGFGKDNRAYILQVTKDIFTFKLYKHL
jgi:hypothetical protein